MKYRLFYTSTQEVRLKPRMAGGLFPIAGLVRADTFG